MEQELNKNNSGTGITHFLQAFGWSVKGFASAVKHESAFRQELLLFCILAPLALWAGHSGVERTLLLGSLMLVLVVELLNTALESVVDRTSQDINPLSGRAKELGSAAVCISLINAACTWGHILLS